MSGNQALVLEEVDGAVGVITFNRPSKKNALDIPMRKAIAAAVVSLSKNANVRCIVITGGEAVFAAGADLNMLVDKSAQEVADINLTQYWQPLKDCHLPVIAAVSGVALGAGCELVMMCDIVIADKSAQFGQPEANVGIMPGAGGTQRLIRAVGKAKASLMLFAGELMDAETACSAGLISEVVESGFAQERAKKIARRVSKMPPKALTAIKRTLQKGADLPIEAALHLENREFLLLFDTDDKKEGMQAFLEKRKPEFTGS